MGEPSNDSPPEEPLSPFVRPHVEYTPVTRLQMAEEIASSRRLIVSPLLKNIMTDPENFYQRCQKSTQMVENAEHRRFVSFNMKREAQIQLKRAEGLPLPAKIPMIEINPTRVTLSLEFESQYYPLMTNDYGEHENVASIMKETNTLIQLPDRFPEAAQADPFVQQVNITGHYSDVDKARKLMRDNCHVTVYMSTAATKISVNELQTHIKKLNPIPNVDVAFVGSNAFSRAGHGVHLRFTSRAKRLGELVAVADEIVKVAFDEPPEDLFSIHFTLSTFHVDHVIGLPTTKLLMPEIESRCHTKITYRQFKSRDEITNNMLELKITGSLRNVLESRKRIIDLLPISVCFNMKNTDMAASTVGENDRNVFFFLDEFNTQVKMTVSIYEPSEVLSGEDLLNCASLRSKEFNIKNVYKAYQKLVNHKLGVIAPESNDYDDSFWHSELNSSFFSFQMPCRGEAPDTVIQMRRPRTASVTSSKPSRSKGPEEPKSRTPSTSETPTPTPMPFVPMHPHYVFPGHAVMPLTFDMMKAAQHHQIYVPYSQPPNYIFNPVGAQMVRPEFLHMLPAEALIPFAPHMMQMTEGDPRLEHAQRLQQAQRRHTSRVGRTVPMSTMTPPRVPMREDDSRSNSARSRRTSAGGDEPFFVGSYEDNVAGGHRIYQQYHPPQHHQHHQPPPHHHHQQQHHQQQYHHHHPQQHYRFTKDESLRLKTPASRESYVKNLAHRGEFRVGSADQDFQTTHHLQLRTPDVDVEQERLFTHDSPHVDENDEQFVDNMQRLFSSVNLNTPFGKRSRAASCSNEKEEPSSRFTDTECAYTEHPLSHHSKSIENFKKGVTKTMLEPRVRCERGINKVNLEIRGKPEHAELDQPGSVRITVDELMASVQQTTGRVAGNIKERKWQDVLEEKHNEHKEPEATMLAEPPFDESSTLDYAFRNEEHSENCC